MLHEYLVYIDVMSLPHTSTFAFFASQNKMIKIELQIKTYEMAFVTTTFLNTLS